MSIGKHHLASIRVPGENANAILSIQIPVSCMLEIMKRNRKRHKLCSVVEMTPGAWEGAPRLLPVQHREIC